MDEDVERGGRKEADEQARKLKGEAMKAWGEWIEKNGLPLEKYRMFNI